MEHTLETLKQIIHEINPAFSKENLSLHDNLFTSGVLDSLTVVQLIVAIEKKFGIKISSKDINYQSFTTMDSILNLVVSKKSS